MRSAILAIILLSGLPARCADVGDRQGIIFILGRDEDPSSPMFRMAETYCRISSEGRGDPVVSNLASMAEVRDYLAGHAPANGRPWGLVQLVVHGNLGGQMALPLFPGGDFLGSRALASAVDRGRFQALPDALLDARSELRIHGCALGQNTELLRGLSKAFGGSDPQRPLVRSSRYFTCYQAAAQAPPTRFLSEAWSVVYPAGRAPSPEALKVRFQKERPGQDLDLADALTRTSPRFPGDTFCSRAPARFHWTLVYKRVEDLPLLEDPIRLRCWLAEQTVFHRRLEEARFTLEELDWRARKVTKTQDDGTQRPAIRVDGSGEVLYILRALTENPAWEDGQYFAMER